jgi:hypothetical protein
MPVALPCRGHGGGGPGRRGGRDGGSRACPAPSNDLHTLWTGDDDNVDPSAPLAPLAPPAFCMTAQGVPSFHPRGCPRSTPPRRRRRRRDPR